MHHRVWGLVKLKPEIFPLTTSRLDLHGTQNLVYIKSIAVEPLTVRPLSAFSKAEPLVPTLPKTLLSSTAWILEILLPTRCWRRKCTQRATRRIRLAIFSGVGGQYDSNWLTFCDFRHLGRLFLVVLVLRTDFRFREGDAIQRGVVMQ